eukprot:jgi/Pico_ML_1/53500/g4035.t1
MYNSLPNGPRERVPVRAAKLSSSATHIPYDFYSIPFCEPEDGPQSFAQNLGEALSGDALHNSEYDLPFLKNKTCTVLCTIDNFEQHPKYRRFRALLKEDQYRANLRMDNMPAVHLVEATTSDGTGEKK